MSDVKGKRYRSRMQLSEEAADYVRNLIMSGELRPGEFLRPEDVAHQLEMSSTPAREGFQSLRAEGFLRLEPRHGFIVLPLGGSDIRDLFTAHALIAGELAARVAPIITKEGIEDLKRLQKRVYEAATDGEFEEAEVANHAFHRMINLLANAPKLSFVLGMLTRYVPGRFYPSIKGWPSASMTGHGAILGAFEARDAAAAREAMTEHITTAGGLLAAHFDERATERTHHARHGEQLQAP